MKIVLPQLSYGKDVPNRLADGDDKPSETAAPRIVVDQMTSAKGRIVSDAIPDMTCDFFMEVRQNGRVYQEDSVAMFTWEQSFRGAQKKSPMILLAVMDGHSNASAGMESTETAVDIGPIVARRMRDGFEQVLTTFSRECFEESSDQREDVIKKLAEHGFIVDKSLQNEGYGMTSGSTFSFALVCESHVVLGNVGDSCGAYCGTKDGKPTRCTWAETFNVRDLSRDKESMRKEIDDIKKFLVESQDLREESKAFWQGLIDEKESKLCFTEFERCEKAGLEVKSRYVGSLSITRSFGDFDLKSNAEISGLKEQGVIALPSMKIVERNKNGTEMIGLFTDGVLFTVEEKRSYYGDNFTAAQGRPDAYGQAAKQLIQENHSVSKVAEALFARAKELEESPDNMGLILVKFNRDPPLNTTESPNKVAKTK